MTDSASIPFRTASPAPAVAETISSTASPAKPGEITRASKTDTSDAPPSLYAELEKKPYAVKFLGLDLYHDDPQFDEVRLEAKALNDYVLKQMKAQGLKDDEKSYKEVVDAIYKQIGRSGNEDPVKALKRLSVAAGAIERLESAKLPPILSAKSLTPTEFEEVQP